jgi:hypothetical protein
MCLLDPCFNMLECSSACHYKATQICKLFHSYMVMIISTYLFWICADMSVSTAEHQDSWRMKFFIALIFFLPNCNTVTYR